MCEILVCVKDRDPTNYGSPQAGDVILVKPDGTTWGECDLGGRVAEPDKYPADAGFAPGARVWTRGVVRNYARDVTMLMDSSTDVSAMFRMNLIPANKVVIRTETEWREVGDKSGFIGFKDMRVDKKNSIVSAVEYDDKVAHEETAGIAEHPNGNHNFFRIIKLPKIAVARAEYLLAGEKDINPLIPSPVLQFRGFYIDQSKAKDAALLAYLEDDSRAAPTITLSYSEAELYALVSQREPKPF